MLWISEKHFFRSPILHFKWPSLPVRTSMILLRSRERVSTTKLTFCVSVNTLHSLTSSSTQVKYVAIISFAYFCWSFSLSRLPTNLAVHWHGKSTSVTSTWRRSSCLKNFASFSSSLSHLKKWISNTLFPVRCKFQIVSFEIYPLSKLYIKNDILGSKITLIVMIAD